MSEQVTAKSSTVTSRQRPVADVQSASGPMRVYAETIVVPTTSRVEIIDLTDQIMRLAHKAGISEGTINLFSTHTTCTIWVNEFQAALAADMRTFLEHIVAGDAGWRHNDPQHSDCERSNAEAHLRAMLLGHSLTLQVSGGEVVLGQWQRILMAELDGPRQRTLRLQAMGVQ
jgi:secondary thiamine-phosphate synthase enzyme